MVTSWHPDPQKTTWINPAAAAELAMAYLCTDCVDIPALGGTKKPKWPIIWPIGHVDADIRINFRIIRQYHAISDICRIYPTYALMRIGKYIRMAIPIKYPLLSCLMPRFCWTRHFSDFSSPLSQKSPSKCPANPAAKYPHKRRTEFPREFFTAFSARASQIDHWPPITLEGISKLIIWPQLAGRLRQGLPS